MVTYLLISSHTAVQIVTPPQVPEHAKVMSCELFGSKSSAWREQKARATGSPANRINLDRL